MELMDNVCIMINTELKIWLINATTLFISITNIDVFLKLLLLMVSIGYTATKWWQLLKKDDDNEL
jgi:hypothetical protein